MPSVQTVLSKLLQECLAPTHGPHLSADTGGRSAIFIGHASTKIQHQVQSRASHLDRQGSDTRAWERPKPGTNTENMKYAEKLDSRCERDQGWSESMNISLNI